jgi:hypothetical protein
MKLQRGCESTGSTRSSIYFAWLGGLPVGFQESRKHASVAATGGTALE